MDARRVQSPTAERLCITCFGTPAISFRGRALGPVPAKAVALIARLALDPGCTLSRAAARLMLWEDQTEARAQASLRGVVCKLTALFAAAGFDGWHGDGATLALDRDRITTDRDTGLARDPAAMPRDGAALLDGLDTLGEGVGTWVAAERARYRHDLIAALEDRLAQARGPDTVACAQALLAVEPLHEGAVQALIQGHAAAGRSANALAVYAQFWRGLDDAYGEEPSARTQGLIVAVKQHRPPADYRIGLMPARGVEGDRPLGAFATLLSNALCTALPETGVLSVHDLRDQRQAPQGGTIDITLVPWLTAAGGAVLVELVAHRACDAKVILARSRQVARGRLTADLAADIAAELVALLCEQLARPACLGEPERHRAAAQVLYGIDQMLRLEGGSVDRAGAAFAAAIALDPKGPYFAWSAYLEAFRCEEGGGFLDPAFREHTTHLAARALEADPWNSLSRALLCHVQSFMFGDFAAAQGVLAPALAAPRTNVMVDDSHALLCFYTGRYGPARRAAERAARLGRFSPYRYLFGTTLCMLAVLDGTPTAALAHGMAALDAHPHQQGRVVFAPLLRYTAAAAMRVGDTARAMALYARIRAQDPRFRVAGLADRPVLTRNPASARLLIDTLTPLEAMMQDTPHAARV